LIIWSTFSTLTRMEPLSPLAATRAGVFWPPTQAPRGTDLTGTTGAAEAGAGAIMAGESCEGAAAMGIAGSNKPYAVSSAATVVPSRGQFSKKAVRFGSPLGKQAGDFRSSKKP
jgi:hypothetical protein